MHDKLEEIYNTMIKESNERMTVGKTNTGDLPDASKGKLINNVTTADNTVDSPKEGPSSTEVSKGGAMANSTKAKDKLNGAKGKMPLGKKNAMENKKTELNDSLNISSSKFEDLYKSVIGEDMDLDGTPEESDEIVSAPDVESDSFDEESGDFTEEPSDMEDEISVASELRTMAERMIELADKYAELTGESEDELGEGDDLGGDELGGEDMAGDDLGGDMADEEVREESFKNQPELRAAKKTTLGPKMSKTVKGKLSSVSKKQGSGLVKGKYTGVPQKLGDKGKSFNRSGMTAKGKGPTVTKKATDLFSK